MTFRTSLVAAVAATVLGGSLIAASPVQAADSVTLNGAGSTFILNYVEACKAGYNAATGNNVNYTGGGSGACSKGDGSEGYKNCGLPNKVNNNILDHCCLYRSCAMEFHGVDRITMEIIYNNLMAFVFVAKKFIFTAITS